MPKIRRERKAPEKVKTWTCRECGKVAKSRRAVCEHVASDHAEALAEKMTDVGERDATPEPLSLVYDVLTQSGRVGKMVGPFGVALCCFDDLKNENDVVVVRELLNETFGMVDHELVGGYNTVPETLEAFIKASAFKQLKACYDQCVWMTRAYRYGANLDRVYDEWWYYLIKVAGKAARLIDDEIRKRKAAKIAELE